MRDTGIIRRLDELGRIVIPKEIRKTLKIEQGDTIEIFVNKGELILKKYTIPGIKEISKSICKILSEIIDKTVLISDKEKIISCNCGKDIKDCRLTEDAIYQMKNFEEPIKTFKIYKGLEQEIKSQAQYPIKLKNGDIVGMVFIVDFYKENSITELDLKILNFATKLLIDETE